MSIVSHETCFAPLTQIVRRRLLATPGEVLVRVGDRVQPDDLVARAPVQGPLVAIDVAESLGISVRTVARCVQVAKGQIVAPGEMLASARRLWGCREVTAPFEAVVQGIADGRIFLRRTNCFLTLRAYLGGEVIEEYPHRGVAIRTFGALVRGIWGAGGEQQGIITTMASRPDDPLTWDRVGLHYRNAIIVGGILEDPRVLLRARQFQVHGLLVGSIAPALKPLAEQLELPIVVTEGMGRIPMAEPILEALRSYHGRPAVISGSDCDGCSGPEIIVSLPSQASSQANTLIIVRPIQVGARVRLTRPPYLGAIGQVVALPAMPQETAVGARAEGAEVRLADGRKVFIPHVNIELLE